MKSKLLTACFSLLVLAGSATVPSSENAKNATESKASFSPFSSFRGHKQGSGITLLWSISNPGQIQRFEVQRSYDGEFFDTISELYCEGNSRFKCSDRDVYPGFIYYRIAAFNAAGTVEYSPIEVVRIVSRK